MPAQPTPADAPLTTATLDARRTKSLLLFHSGVGAVEKIRHRYACENSSEKSRHTWRKDEAETQSGGTPRSHAIRARNQMAEAALKSTAAWFLFHFARTGAGM
jgi:hypothetical protein